eukprot:CAMPEP_0194146046 /NCGR_PEP_ID=MMETSP0152-20130528/19366_1 /TAXON_ID=1049557 /ORGANISM="Thalassiothrix antarctica, Strain L6-D1" /LENGTH=154 /DNA_ID=CAMNT_0038846451 /DNA_START=236 /DNA_END=700 /DNA_ORIENTATION=+
MLHESSSAVAKTSIEIFKGLISGIDRTTWTTVMVGLIGILVTWVIYVKKPKFRLMKKMIVNPLKTKIVVKEEYTTSIPDSVASDASTANTSNTSATIPDPITSSTKKKKLGCSEVKSPRSLACLSSPSDRPVRGGGSLMTPNGRRSARLASRTK